jgi:hypothetical protein
MRQEPYVKLLTSTDFKKMSDDELIIENQQFRQQQKYNFYRLAFDYISENDIHGDYHEYGVHKCRTFRMALTEAFRYRLNSMNFWAFDSFEGLPPSESHSNSLWSSGALATSELTFKSLVNNHGLFVDNVKIIKGFYNQSLTNDFAKKMLDEENKIAMVTVDCDLYESAVPVFKFISNLIQPGTIIYIDDVFVGNKGQISFGVWKAWEEFIVESRFSFEPFLSVGWWGKSFIVNY